MMYRLHRALLSQQTSLLRRRFLSQIPRGQTRASSQLRHGINGEPLRYQAVRFRKPGIFSLRRIVTLGLYAGVAFGYLSLILRYLDIEIEIVDEDDHDQVRAHAQSNGNEQGDEEEDEEEDDVFYADDDSLFIPLTWARKMPRSYYRGSDPEWQEFLKVARDKQRHTKIQDELVQLVFAGSAQHPQISRQLGKDATVGKYWLDISFPDGPPQEYERSGLEIGDGFIAWSQQRITQESQWRLTRALWPSAAAGGVWAATKTLAGIQYRRLKQALGLEGKDPFSPEERYRHMLEMMQKQQQLKKRTDQVSKTPTETGTESPSTGGSPAPSSASADPPKRLPWHIPVHLPSSTDSVGSPAASADLPIAMHAFNHTLSKSWNPKKLEPPKGTFIVQGLVEVRGSRGRILFDVQSAYDPRQGKYVQVSAGVRNFKKWNQAPRGGP